MIPQHWMHRNPHLIRRGPDANGAKMTAKDIEVARAMKRNGMRPILIAEHFRVSRQTIWRQTRNA